MSFRLDQGASVAVSAAIALLSATGCFVPQNRYDDAVTRLKGEERAHAAATAELGQAKAELARLDATLKSREGALSTRDGDLAQSKLDADRVSTERDDAIALAEQIRGELVRAGEHLREYSAQKQELTTALALADQKLAELDSQRRYAEDRALLMRDISLGLGDDVTHGRVVVSALEGKPLVRIPSKTVFAGAEVRAEAEAVLGRLAAAVAQRPGARVELSDQSTDALSVTERSARLKRVAEVLSGKGIGLDRIGFAAIKVPDVTAGAAATPTAAPLPTAQRDGQDGLQIVVDPPST